MNEEGLFFEEMTLLETEYSNEGHDRQPCQRARAVLYSSAAGGIDHDVDPIADGSFSVRVPAGAQEDLVWDGRGQSGTLTWTSSSPVDNVVLDPAHRLVESPKLAEDHPTADNMEPLPWRPPMITQLLIWGDIIALEPFFVLNLAMRRKYDITNSFHAGGSFTPRSFGGTVAYLRHFGPKRTLNART